MGNEIVRISLCCIPGKGRDKLSILEDTDNDRQADKFLHFNDTLNMPIGIMPVNDGALVYSIPNVYKFVDADGDGKADSLGKDYVRSIFLNALLSTDNSNPLCHLSGILWLSDFSVRNVANQLLVLISEFV